jgi:ribosome maturation factor RimP
VSRDLSAALDVHEEMVPGRYELEVGSPGLDRPLTRLADYIRFTGREAKIETGAKIDGRRRFRGPILGVEGDAVRLEQDGSPVTIPFVEIEKANLVLVLPTRR